MAKRGSEESLRAAAARAARERVVLVDADNRITGAAPRARMRSGRLWHRATYIFVFHPDTRLLVQRRTTVKDAYPGFFDLAAGGVVNEGESYEDNAAREAEEELGIVEATLTPHLDFRYEDEVSRGWGRVFTCVHPGPFRLQPEEVAAAEFATREDVDAGRFAPVTPDTRIALDTLLAHAHGVWPPHGGDGGRG